jgi:hypothetical protein
VISAVPFILPNQLGRFPGSIGLISAITFPRRVIWIDRFVFSICLMKEEQLVLNFETGTCFIGWISFPAAEILSLLRLRE